MPHYLLMLLIACAPEEAAVPALDDTATTSFTPTLPIAECGAGSYPWLPTDTMGELLETHEDEALSMSAETFNLLLESLDLVGPIVAVYDVRTWEVRYQTQDRGQAVEATGFLVLPEVEPGTSVPVILWNHPTMGFTDPCAPTALGLTGAAFPLLFASLGFAVAAPDYLGMAGFGAPSERLHPYLVAEPTAIVALDSVRALDRLAREEGTAAAPDLSRIIHWGASEGGFASIWTDRYQEGYAPELDTLATVAVVVPTDLEALGRLAVASPSAATGGLAAAMIGSWDWYGRAADLSEVLTDETPSWIASTLPDQMRETCSDFPAVAEVAEVADLFTPPFVDGLLGDDPTEPWGCYLQAEVLRESPVERGHAAPMLFALAAEDELVLPPPTLDDIAPLCAQGYEIEVVRCAGADHVSGAADSLTLQLDWIRARLAGEALGPNCVVPEPTLCSND